jgi:hypothetical protein
MTANIFSGMGIYVITATTDPAKETRRAAMVRTMVKTLHATSLQRGGRQGNAPFKDFSVGLQPVSLRRQYLPYQFVRNFIT